MNICVQVFTWISVFSSFEYIPRIGIGGCFLGLPRWCSGKESACNAGDLGEAGSILGWEDPLEKKMATHSSILVWEIPCIEEPSGLESMGSQRVRHDWVHRGASMLVLYLTFWEASIFHV